MVRSALLVAVLIAASCAQAQDIVGLEDCTKAKGPDKKFGCLQANVEFLHGLVRKNAAAAQARLREQAAKLAEATATLDDLRVEVARLKAALDQVEKKIPRR